MVQLRESVATTPNMAKSKTPKSKTPKSKTPKSKTPKSETPKSAKKTPKVAEMKVITPLVEEVEEQLATPSPKTPKSKTPKSKTPKSKTPKSKTPKQKGKKAAKVVVEEENEDSESEEENLEAEGEDSVEAMDNEESEAEGEDSVEAMDNEESEAEGEDSAEAMDDEESEAEEEITVKKKSSPKKKKVDEQEEIKLYTMYVRNINYRTEFKTFQQYFKQFGSIKKIHLSRNKRIKGRNIGYGFIDFENEDDMKKALEAEHELDQMRLTVRPHSDKDRSLKRKRGEDDDGPEKKKLTFEHEVWVGNLDYSTTAETLEEHFSPFGEVIKVTLPKNHDVTKANSGFAFVAFGTAEAVNAAAAVKDHSIDSINVCVQNKKETKKKFEKKLHSLQVNVLFMSNLCKTTIKETLLEHFSKYGKIASSSLPIYKLTNQNKGFMFISYETAESLGSALAEVHCVDGNKLNVTRDYNRKQPKPTKNNQKKKEEVTNESEDQAMEDESDEAEEEDNEENMEENDDNSDEDDE